MPGEQGPAQGREAAMGFFFGHHPATVLCSMLVQASSTCIPMCRLPLSRPSPQDVSSQPTAVLCLGLLSKPRIPVPSPCLQWWTPSQAGWAGLGAVPCVEVSLCPAASDSCCVLFPQKMRLLCCPNWAPPQ